MIGPKNSTATIIASQAVISGVFSITSQAVQLGYIPRLRVKHTSDKEYGEVYLSKINLFLFLGVALLIIGFKSSENLSHAYGISVTGAMLVDTILATYLLITVRKWNKLIFIPVFLGLLIIDFVFLSSNLVKIFDGGWFPIVIASGLLVIMLSWIIGRERMLAARWNGSIKINQFISQLKRNRIKRVPGTAIFFVPNLKVVPMAMLHNLKHNKILHKRIVCMHLKFENFPKLRNDERLIVKHLGSNFYTIIVRYGFQEEPNIPRVLALLRASEFKFNMEETSFFVGKVKVIAKDPSIITRLFIFMHRIMMGATEYYKGWFGFNAGSAVAANGSAGMAMLVTQIAAATAGVAWMLVEWFSGEKKPSLLGMCSGAVAGLVAITPASGFVGPSGAFFIGLAAGIFCYLTCTKLKSAFGYDDSLDVFGIHALGGALGAILTGVFTLKAIGGTAGLLEGNAAQVKLQLIGVGVTVVYTAIATFIILKVVNFITPLRASDAQERD
ncbi:MAG: hypothetical protein EB016_03600, partial [Proteobacteria bacterium]|nr:hypothetical protein [Pseudomonadota bacterium]